MIRKKTLRLLLCDYQRTARYYTIYRTFKRWSSDDFTTIGYDYSSRNATTIARPYWLSGDSPKRAAAVAANGSAPPAGLLRRVEGDRPPALTTDPVPDLQPPGVGSIETPPG